MGAVENPVRAWLRVEALVLFVGAVLVWVGLQGGWWRFAAGFLLPDLAIAAYLIGPRSGAAVYNLVHSYAIPATLAIIGAVLDHPPLTLAGALWTSHIAFDRVVGLGLKYPSDFTHTHLGRVRAVIARPTASTVLSR
jgi:hypothetical protein